MPPLSPLRRMGALALLVVPVLGLAALLARAQQEPQGDRSKVGSADSAGLLTSTFQLLKPAGQHVEFPGRAVDLALSPDASRLYAKDNRGLVVIDTATWKLLQEIAFPESGGSMHGIAVTSDGKRILATSAADHLYEATLGADGQLAWSRTIDLPGPTGKDGEPVHACGIALTPDDSTAYLCLSRNNAIGVVDLKAGKLIKQIPVGVAPFDVVLADAGKSLWVSNWGGRRPQAGEKTAPSSGTPVLIDDRGVASSGTVGKIDLATGAMTLEIATGLHPSDLELQPDRNRLYVANANSDTVSIIDTATSRVIDTLDVKPDPALPFGSAPNALTLTPDGHTLLVALGGNNALAVVDVAATDSKLQGFIPTAWYPGAVTSRGGQAYIANIKGLGSRDLRGPAEKGRSVYWYKGVISKLDLPDSKALATYTLQVKEQGRVPQILKAQERAAARAETKPVPVPKIPGEPSVFEHIVYVIKENRTYDQVFGDLPQGDGDPNLTMFGREVSPNHHALAEKYVLLDNYYCNGVLSADGHSWTTEGYVTDHLEKAFGGFTRSYTFGDDPITYASSGFIWDQALLRGLSFRNYGEMDNAEPVPADSTFLDIYRDFVDGRNKVTFTQSIGIDTLRRYSSPTTPGWNMKIPDILRVDRFLAEFREYEKNGDWPNFITLHLPQDHGSGTTPDMPTPRAHMADNDLALGRLVEAISKSKYWATTCIFVIEDDPQNGFDHVDGHRSICLVISPYTKRKQVVSNFYNQTSVLHTMCRIIGVPPMNQIVALSPPMDDCFTEEADLSPYEAITPSVPLDELNKPRAQLSPRERHWADLSVAQDFTKPDRADDDTLNRIIWHAIKGVDTPYPADLAGPHGKGLAGRKLRIIPGLDDDDDEEEDEDDDDDKDEDDDRDKNDGR